MRLWFFNPGRTVKAVLDPTDTPALARRNNVALVVGFPISRMIDPAA
jgi:hypothetical protein